MLARLDKLDSNITQISDAKKNEKLKNLYVKLSTKLETHYTCPISGEFYETDIKNNPGRCPVSLPDGYTMSKSEFDRLIAHSKQNKLDHFKGPKSRNEIPLDCRPPFNYTLMALLAEENKELELLESQTNELLKQQNKQKSEQTLHGFGLFNKTLETPNTSQIQFSDRQIINNIKKIITANIDKLVVTWGGETITVKGEEKKVTTTTHLIWTALQELENNYTTITGCLLKIQNALTDSKARFRMRDTNVKDIYEAIESCLPAAKQLPKLNIII